MLGALALSACGSDGDIETTLTPSARPEGANLFANPSFEEGPEPWISLETSAWGKPFSVSQRQVQSGANSALLELRSMEEGAGAARRYGVVQELDLEEFPDVLSGYYYVERWEQETPKQYLQVAFIVFDAANIPPEAGASNFQVRYVLAGVPEPPFQLTNGRFVMVGTEAPVLGQWVYFERNVRRDFEDLWGVVPDGFSKLRILFEVNWDDRTQADGLSAADVFYDNLYLGPTGED